MKVSQYFELPLYTKGGFLHQSDGSGKPLVQFATKEQADIAANCINRAGALAGALNDIAIVAASIPLDEAHHDLTYIYARAVEALAAYRGWTAMKVSDFLELPTNAVDLYVAMTYDTTREKDRAIANCVNHADALADALASMLEHEEEMAYSVWGYKDGRVAIFEQSEEFARFNDSFADELAALEAYRGAK